MQVDDSGIKNVSMATYGGATMAIVYSAQFAKLGAERYICKQNQAFHKMDKLFTKSCDHASLRP